MKYVVRLIATFFLCAHTVTQTTPTAHLVGRYKTLAAQAIQNRNYQDAFSYYSNALTLSPQDATLEWDCGNALKELGKFEEAITHFENAIHIDPNNLTARFSLANTFTLAEQPENALEHYRIVLAHYPDIAQIVYNYGFALKKAGYIAQALAVYERVLVLDPAYTHAHFSKALAYLALGDFERGWPEYEWRDTLTKGQKAFFADKVCWDGTQDLTNKTILLVAEQGLGDTFEFIRYAQLLKTMFDCTIICQVQPALMTILSNCPFIDTLLSHKDSLDGCAFDYYSQLMSLPYRCGTVESTIPASIPYLFLDDALVNQWRTKLAADKKFKIGICWQGNTQYIVAELQRAVAAKSVTPHHFAPIAAVDNVSLYSLQKVDNAYNGETIPFAIHFFDDQFDQANGHFMDTAAVMKNLDLIITVDTSVAHCAGALGVPVWVVLPHPADWRWLLERTDTPWYPTMRLFRQQEAGNWQAVFDDVAHALQEEINRKKN